MLVKNNFSLLASWSYWKDYLKSLAKQTMCKALFTMSQIIISRRLHDNGVTMTPKRPLASIFFPPCILKSLLPWNDHWNWHRHIGSPLKSLPRNLSFLYSPLKNDVHSEVVLRGRSRCTSVSKTFHVKSPLIRLRTFTSTGRCESSSTRLSRVEIVV